MLIGYLLERVAYRPLRHAPRLAPLITAIGMSIILAHLALMVWVLRPFLKRVCELHTSNENLSKPIVAIFFLALLLSAFATEVIGIHALFGAFLAGTIMPDNLKGDGIQGMMVGVKL